MAKISIGTLLWKRHDVFECWATCIERLKKDFPEHSFEIVVVGSEGTSSRKITEDKGFVYAECRNIAGLKANMRLNVMREGNPDYYIFCGSDDIISSEAFHLITTKAKSHDEATTMTMYYYDTVTKQLLFSRGYAGTPRQGEPLAPWRLMTQDLVKRIGDPWPARSKNLDGHFHKIVKSIPHKSFRYANKMILDIKGPGNITPFSRVAAKTKSNKVELVELFRHLPKSEAHKILQL